MSEALYGKLNQNPGALCTKKQPHKYSNAPPQASYNFFFTGSKFVCYTSHQRGDCELKS